MNKIIMLYGSQNFGYDTELSDKDYLQFILPTWDNIVNNKLISYETKSNIDNGIIKVKDIRLIINVILIIITFICSNIS